MRWFRNIFLLSSATVFLILNTSCNSPRQDQNHRYSEAAPGELLLATPPLGDPASFSKWIGPVSEYDKIRCLLDRIATSEYRFFRNGEAYDGKMARQWFLYKMTHWVEGVDTAEEFVNQVTSYSQKTGELYLVEFPDGRAYSLKSVLQNELIAFEKRRAELRQLAPPSITQPSPVPISPATVATTAVATRTISTSKT